MASSVQYYRAAEWCDAKLAPDGLSNDMLRAHANAEIPAVCVRNKQDLSLESCIEICSRIISRGLLPVIRLFDGDSTPAFRNLVEVCCAGFLELSWTDGAADFDPEGALGTITAAGRNHFPIDLALDPGSRAPAGVEIERLLSDLERIVEAHEHVQTVQLLSVPAEGESLEEKSTLDFFARVLKTCPKAVPAARADLWTRRQSVRRMVRDLGCVIAAAPSSPGETFPDPLGPARYMAESLGTRLAPRLPITQAFYRAGRFSFEVGKVLDTWTDRKSFRYYREREGWLNE